MDHLSTKQFNNNQQLNKFQKINPLNDLDTKFPSIYLIIPIILIILFIPVHPLKSVETTDIVIEVYGSLASLEAVGPKVDKIVAICRGFKTSILKACVQRVSWGEEELVKLEDFVFVNTPIAPTHGTKGTVADIAYYGNISWN